MVQEGSTRSRTIAAQRELRALPYLLRIGGLGFLYVQSARHPDREEGELLAASLLHVEDLGFGPALSIPGCQLAGAALS